MNKSFVLIIVGLMIITSFLPLISFAMSSHTTAPEDYNRVAGSFQQNKFRTQVPIKITTQTPNFSLVYQQMLIIGNSSRNYSYYGINARASNFLFSYGNGTNIYCWVQSINISSIVLWVRLPQNVNQTIYLNVYPSFENFLSATGYLGEAPQLSPTYGQYDNGIKVFPYYENYSIGQNITSAHIAIENTGTVTFDNALIVNSTNYERLRLTEKFPGGTYYVYVSQVKSGNYKLGWMQGSYSKNSTFGNLSSTPGIVNFYDTNSSRPYPAEEPSAQYDNLIIQWSFVAMIPDGAMPAYVIGPPSLIRVYTVIFIEAGLPRGTYWTATLAGVSQSSSSQSITFYEINGTYRYSIGGVSGFLYNASLPSIQVKGANLNVSIVFSKLYMVTFLESGLTNGTFWAVTLGDHTVNSGDSSIAFQVLNGTYSYYIQAVKGMSSSIIKGNLTVNGKNETVSVTFSKLVQFTFYVIGLPEGSQWSVLIDNTYYNSSVSFITIDLTNESHDYKILLPFDYVANPSSGSVEWDTGVVLINATHPTSYPLPVIGLIVVVAIIILSLLLTIWKRRSK